MINLHVYLPNEPRGFSSTPFLREFCFEEKVVLGFYARQLHVLEEGAPAPSFLSY